MRGSLLPVGAKDGGEVTRHPGTAATGGLLVSRPPSRTRPRRVRTAPPRHHHLRTTGDPGMNLRRLTRSIAAALIAIGLGTSGARAELVLPRPSPNASVSQTIGVTNFTLTYSRPGVKGRVIWGGLVPYDSTWRTGANDPSSLTVSDTISVAGHT